MYNNKKILAVIPARGGSKGIPRKNIVKVLNKPLIGYSIEQALASKFLDEVIVSTDDQEIANISKEFGAHIPFLRPKELATDDSKTIDSLLHAIKYFKSNGKLFDYIVLLQPTQPLRQSWHIDEAIKKLIDSKANSLVSISKVSEHPILIREIDDNDRLKKLLNINSTVRRQDMPIYYKVNGAIYINKINNQFNANTSLNDNNIGYEMDVEYDIDIDDPIDLLLLEHALVKMRNN